MPARPPVTTATFPVSLPMVCFLLSALTIDFSIETDKLFALGRGVRRFSRASPGDEKASGHHLDPGYVAALTGVMKVADKGPQVLWRHPTHADRCTPPSGHA